MRSNYELKFLKRADNPKQIIANTVLDIYPKSSFFGDKNNIDKQNVISKITANQDRFNFK